MAYNNQQSIDDAMAKAVADATAPLNARIQQQEALIKAQAETIKQLSGGATPPNPGPTPPGDLRGWLLDATNTGLAGAGVDRNTLQPYTGPSKPAAGTTITLKKITYPELICSNGNIVLDRCWIAPSAAAGRAGIIFGLNPDTGGNQLGDITIKDCDIDASAIVATGDQTAIYKQCAFRGAGSLYRNNIWGMGTGIAYFGDPAVATSLIERNYVHDLRSGIAGTGSGAEQSHGEAATVRRFAGTKLTWKDNRLESHMQANSGAMFIQANGWVDHVALEGNMLSANSGHTMGLEFSGGGYGTDMRAINNRFVFSGAAGYGVYVTGGPGWAGWSENYQLDKMQSDYKGTPVSKPNP